MKFNLKNFPKTAEGETRDDADVWAENFEKELREQLVVGEKAEKAWRGGRKHRVDEEIAMEWHGSNLKIKQVLGVEPKIKEETEK